MPMTLEQKEVFDLHKSGMNVSAIARKLNRSRASIRERLQRASEHADADPAVLQAMNDMGITTIPNTVWFKNDSYSIQVRPEQLQERSFQETVRDVMTDLPAAMKIPAPRATITDDMVVYPLFDVHLGLRAHAEVSGVEVTLESAVEEVLTGLANMVALTPKTRRAVIVNGGDFTHQTNDLNATRRSGHVLDVAARNYATVEAAMSVICTVIEMLLRKHAVVEYHSVPGNHDPQNWETIQVALRERYRGNPRVKIDVRWDEFSIVEHGEVALFIHHGDKRKPKDLAMFCASSFPEVWGRTRFRMLLTGHTHHMKEDEFPGIIWRQFSAVTARDHYAASHGYNSHRMLNALVFDLRAKKLDFSALL